MKLLHVTPSYFPATRYGGPIYSVHGLCRALVEKGHKVTVFTTNVDGSGTTKTPLNRPVVIDGVRVYYFSTGAGRRFYRSPAMGKALLKLGRDFEIWHSHSVFLWPGVAAGRAARQLGMPIVISPRGMLVRDLIRRKGLWRKAMWIRLFERSNLESAQAIHCTSPLERRELRAFGWRLPSVEIIPNGIASTWLVENRECRIETGENHILFLGRLSWKKGLDRLIEALARVPRARLLIAGGDSEGYGKEILRRVRTLGIEERVQFLGEVSMERARGLVRDCRFLVLPSYQENFGNVVLEAMAQGRAVLVTEDVGASQWVREHQAGYVCSGSVESLSDAMKNLWNNRERADAMGRRGRAVVRSEFEWSHIAQRMTYFYAEVAQNGR